MAPLSDYFPSFLLLIPPIPTQVPIFYLKASARFPILERRAAKTIVWREQFHQHYCAHVIFYLLIITIITIGTFSPMQVIHAEREETNIQNWSVICHLVIKKTGKGMDCDWKSWKLTSPAHLFFFSSTKKRLVTNSTLSNTMQLQPFIGLLFDIYCYKAGIFFQTKRSLILFFFYFGSHKI